MAITREDLSAYLDGELSPELRAEIEGKVAADPAWREELARLHGVHNMFATIEEHPDVRAGLRARIGSETAMRPSPQRRYTLQTILAIAAVLAIGFVVLWMNWNSPIREQNAPVIATPVEEPAPDAPEALPVEEPDTPMVVAEAPEPPAAVTLPLELTGTLTGAQPVAILRSTDSGEEDSYGVGDEVAPGVTLVAVRQDEAVFSRDGAQFTLAKLSSAEAFTLEGLWTITYGESRGDEMVEEARSKATLTQEGPVVSLEAETGALAGTGQLRGTLLTVELPVDHYGATILEGRLNGDWTVFECVGSMKINEEFIEAEIQRAIDRKPDDAEYVAQIREQYAEYVAELESRQFYLRGERVPEEAAQVYVASMEVLEERLEQVQPVADALDAYAKDNGGHYPETLAALAPRYLSEEAVLSNDEGLRVYYSPKSKFVKPDAEVPESLESIIAAFADLSRTEQIIRYSAGHRVKFAGGSPLPLVVLKLEYAQPEMTIWVDGLGAVSDSFRDSGKPAAESQAMRMASMNNLKQLGLVCKMFEGEHDGHTPGDWAVVYPEYLQDTNVLSSPCDEPGTLSYHLIFPGAEANYFSDELFERTGQDIPFNKIPWVYESYDWETYENGRNVGYADGHVEFLSAERFAEEVQPLIDLPWPVSAAKNKGVSGVLQGGPIEK